MTEQIGGDTQVALTIVIALVGAAVAVVGAWWVVRWQQKEEALARAALEKRVDALEVAVRQRVKKHTCSNYLQLVQARNPEIDVPRFDEIQSQE